MTWVKLDDRFCDHPKIAALSDRAFRALVTGICYSSGVMSDGAVPTAVAKRIAGPATKELLRSCVWEQNGSGYLIHDFLDYQPSKADILAKRAADSARKSRGNRNGTG